jgi:acetaldehyde dehydrogenase (acetylating)
MIKIAIIGTGQIGFDLLHKILNLDFVEVVAFVGRRECSKKLPNNINYSDESINFFILNPKCCEVVFDCTDAYSAIINSKIFFEQGIKVIDLTPSNVGRFYIPNIKYIHLEPNINMVTCGGQASIPLLNYLNKKLKNITYAEVVTQINSESAGMATRINIDKYIDITEKAIYEFTNIQNCKVILNINPSINTIMKSTIFIKTSDFDEFDDFDKFIETVQNYIKTYNVSKPVWISTNLLMVHITVTSSSNLISKYAGNLDIINCAAIVALKTIYYNK